MAKKPQRRRSVKHSKPQLSQQQLLDYHQQLRDLTLDPEHLEHLPGDEPHWFAALESKTGSDYDHPSHGKAMRRILSHPPLQEKWTRATELVSDFSAALPDDLKPAWFEIERVQNERHTIDCIAHYNVGVDDGCDHILVKDAMASGGINTAQTPTRTLFVLAYLLGEIARRLDLSHHD